MDVKTQQQITQALEALYSPNTPPPQRSNIESFLSSLSSSTHPFLLPFLLSLSSPSSLCSPPARQLASILFKRKVEEGWEGKEAKEEEKGVVRENILAVLLAKWEEGGWEGRGVRGQLLETIKYILGCDYPERWGGLVEGLLGALGREKEREELESVLMCLLFLMKKYEWETSGGGEWERLVDQIFPVLGPFLVHLQTDFSLDSFILQKQVLKIFYSSSRLRLPPPLYNIPILSQWVSCFLTTLSGPLPPSPPSSSSYPPLDDTWPVWKAKKWALHIFNRFFSHFSEFSLHSFHSTPPSSSSSPLLSHQEWCQAFKQQFSLPILQQVLSLLGLPLPQQSPPPPPPTLPPLPSPSSPTPYPLPPSPSLPPSLLRLSLDYITTSISYPPTWAHLQTLTHHLFHLALFPLVTFSAQDRQIWCDDPHEFVRREMSSQIEYTHPRPRALALISSLTTASPSFFLPFLTHFLVHLLSFYASSPPSHRHHDAKGGAMLLLAHLSPHLFSSPSSSPEPLPPILDLLTTHFLPHLENSAGSFGCDAGNHADFLRWSCLVSLSQFTALYPNIFPPPPHSPFLSLIRSIFLSHPHWPLRLQGALVLESAITGSHARDALRGNFAEIFEGLFSLMREVDSEELVKATQTILIEFREEIAPFSHQLISHLSSQLSRLISSLINPPSSPSEGWGNNKEDVEREEQEEVEIALTAAEYAQTILTVLSSVRASSPSLLPSLFSTLCPTLSLALEEDCFDFLEVTLKILALFAGFHPLPLPVDLWKFYPRVIAAFDDYGFDYLEDFIPFLRNMAIRNPESYVTAGTSDGVTFCDSSLRVIKFVLGGGEGGMGVWGDGKERREVMKWVGELLRGCGGRLDAKLFFFLSLVGRCLEGEGEGGRVSEETFSNYFSSFSCPISPFPPTVAACCSTLASAFLYNPTMTSLYLHQNAPHSLPLLLLLAHSQGVGGKKEMKGMVAGLSCLLRVAGLREGGTTEEERAVGGWVARFLVPILEVILRLILKLKCENAQEDKNTKKGGYAENEEIECTTPPSPLDELNVCLFLVKNIQSSGLEEQLSPSSSLYCSLSEEARGCLGSVLDYVRGRSG